MSYKEAIKVTPLPCMQLLCGSIWSTLPVDWTVHRFWQSSLLHILLVFPFHDWSNHCATTFKEDGLWTYLNQIVACSPWVLYILMLATFHFSWSTFLLLNQLFQIAFLGLTSHERISLLKQSKHMKQTLSLRKTPYNLGFMQNLADFFQCGCCGLVKPCMVDWTSQYTMVFHPAREKVLRSVWRKATQNCQSDLFLFMLMPYSLKVM